ncbi:MAG: hypothetical protein AVDCRST_MAG42-2263 [uncultured Chthoniobacterales bacterium]|uniref:Uncharacterized protein n=1 Tax=uncultured Chthoniobacterales bacterium TaxID=1836801 RepID=A0A6J4IIR6_9BACT|nr:MAG: hypothetical protein AVDCRST_MAG42-2263 [uncultured Chthoniobacterales bacterium]
MVHENDERPRSRSAAESDTGIRHAAIAALAYGALRALSAFIGGMQQPSAAVWFFIDFAVAGLVLGLLAYFISRRSRIAVVLAIAYVAGTQLYVWFGIRSAAGTIVSAIVIGFLFRGARRIFEYHRQRRDVTAATEPEPS